MINGFLNELAKISVSFLSLFFGIISPLIATFILDVENVPVKYFFAYVVFNIIFYVFSGVLIKAYVTTKYQTNGKTAWQKILKVFLIVLFLFFALGIVLPFVQVGFPYFTVANSIVLIYPLFFVYIFLVIFLGVQEVKGNLKKDLMKIDRKLNKIINKLK